MGQLLQQKRRAVIAGVTLAACLAIALVVSASFFGGNVAASPSYSVTVQVNTNGGTGPGLAGVVIGYNCNSTYLSALGQTDANGTVTGSVPGGSCVFSADYRGTTASQTVDITDSGQTVTFATGAVTIQLVDHTGTTGISGATAGYTASSTLWSAGHTAADGTVVDQMFPGTYQFQMNYKGMIVYQNATVANNSTVTFQTAQVTLEYSGAIGATAPGGYLFSVSKPSMELLPGTYSFSFIDYNQPTCNLSLTTADAGKTSEASIIKAVLRDSSGNPESGGIARAYITVPGHSSYWTTLGTTDANGVACHAYNNLLLGSTPVSMQYKISTSGNVTQDVATKSLYPFQTGDVTVKLIDHAGNGLSGGQVDYTGDTFQGYSGYRSLFGNTGADGTVSQQLFPGNFNFTMTYNATQETQSGVAVSDGTVVTFQTAQLTLVYSGGVSFVTPFGYLHGFTKPSMELLPGSYDFEFINYGQPTCTLNLATADAGKTSEAHVVKAILRDSDGNLESGGVARDKITILGHSSYWTTLGKTDANGVACQAYFGTLVSNSMTVSMQYGISISSFVTQDVSANSAFQFQTGAVTVTVENSDSAPESAVPVSFTGPTYSNWYSGYMSTFGVTGDDGTVSGQLFPGTYNFYVLRSHVPVAGTTNVAVSNGTEVTLTYNP